MVACNVLVHPQSVSHHAAGSKLSLHEIKWRVPVSFDKITDDPKLSYFLVSSVTTRQQPLDPFGERNFFQGVIHWVSPAPSNNCQTARSPLIARGFVANDPGVFSLILLRFR